MAHPTFRDQEGAFGRPFSLVPARDNPDKALIFRT